MPSRPRAALLLILLAIVEVILTEIAIRSGIAGVERATTILFIVLLLNIALVLGIRPRQNQGEQ